MFDHSNLKETIICAAIWFPNENQPPYTVKNKTGLVLCGHRHGHILGQYNAMGGKYTKVLSVQGFLTNHNNFLDRKEAHKLFIENGGSPEFSDELYSEDLY